MAQANTETLTRQAHNAHETTARAPPGCSLARRAHWEHPHNAHLVLAQQGQVQQNLQRIRVRSQHNKL